MKKVCNLLVALAISGATFAQCHKVTGEFRDTVQNRTYTIQLKPIQAENCEIRANKNGWGVISVVFKGKGNVSCIRERMPIIFYLEDGSSVEMFHAVGFSTNGIAVVKFRGIHQREKEFRRLLSRYVIGFKIVTMGDYLEIYLNDEQQVEFWEVLNCLSN